MMPTTHRHNSAADRVDVSEDGIRARKQAMLVIGVASVTVVIVIGWLFVLPSQLQGLDVMSGEERARWDAVQQEVSSQSGDLQTALDSMQDSYDTLEQRVKLQSGSSDGGRVPTEAIERLQAVISDIQTNGDTGTVAGAESEIQPETHATQDIEQ